MTGAPGRRLVVVSNRVPNPRANQPQAGGLAVALSGALARRGGLWFGWDGRLNSGPVNRPRVEHHGGIDYATLPLARQDYDDYYLGFANEVLWPVCHFSLSAMDYRRSYAEGYERVNRLFADALTPLLHGDEMIWVHDYHVIPLARELRERGVRQPIGLFLHIPFPSHDLLRALPGYRRLLEDLCRYDLVGFQTADDRHAFEDSVRRGIGALEAGEGLLRHRDHTVRTGVYPVGVDVGELSETARRTVDAPRVRRLVHGLGERDLIVGVDRLDYSKGLPQRLRAFESLLQDYPHRRGHTVFMQIASPSRTAIAEYDDLRQRLEGLSGHINGSYADLDWVPVHYLNKTFARGSLMGLYRAARVGLVTPLRDGMNLVAKEFVATQDPENPGVLVLSELAGAAVELDAAVLVNPYDIDTIAAGLNEALAMPLPERRRRHARMLETLQGGSIHEWERRFLGDLAAA